MAKNRTTRRPAPASPAPTSPKPTRERVLVLSGTGKRRFDWRDKH